MKIQLPSKKESSTKTGAALVLTSVVTLLVSYADAHTGGLFSAAVMGVVGIYDFFRSES